MTQEQGTLLQANRMARLLHQVAEESEAKKAVEEALAASEAKLKQAVDMARDKVMALSKENAELKKGRKR